MKPAAIRRFSIAEIVLHWANAVLYLVLFITGTLILIKRIFEVEIALPESLSLIHRIAGISLISILALTIILSIFIRGFRQLWDSLRQCLTWESSDLIWFIKMPFNVLFERVTLPPAGRFNPGQKLHLLVVFTVLLGFSISGLVIILIPGTLAAWVVHLICFVPAAMFLFLHLFLSIINPPTRKSLPAIFTGFVSAEYARKHHPLWIQASETKSHDSHVSLPALTLAVIALTGIITLAIFYYGPQHAQENIQKLISQRGTTSILPGPLAKSHADDPELKYCSTCHQSFLTPSTNACLSCHKLIDQRMMQQSGFHGKMTGQCRSCHRDHLGEDADIRNFDTTKFDHDLANYKLQGKHSKLACQKCHLVKADENETVRTKYVGLNFEKCTDCHKDPHLSRFEQACIVCHSEKGWKGSDLVFSHNKDSQFTIDQIHSHLDCASCHKDIEAVLFKPLPTTCEKCHDNIEKLSYGITKQTVSKPYPHAGRVTCTQCHQTDIQDQSESVYADKCKSCHNEKYEHLYYDWSQVFDMRALQAEKLLLKLSDEDLPQSTQLTERIKEANETGFHNIDLANKLWDQISFETQLPNKK